ncbi:hypothetical protein ACFY3V_08780 [Streptosporangium sp. NPDC000095]|uniref:hypothetical protein n=1 Tax=Streptosporangium sp. NPDC000095 TaxID=3366184 RepID=UPI0036B7EE65
MNPGPDGLAPNPRRQVLEQTLVELKARVALLEAALDPAHGQLTGKSVWVGPKARTFTQDFTARNNRLRQTARALIDTIEEELRSAPAKVPPSTTRQ